MAFISARVGSRLRRLGVASATLVTAGLAGWVALHRVPDLAPALADLARDLVGDDAVARAEDLAYGVQDRIVRAAHHGDAPQARWDIDQPAVTASDVKTSKAEMAEAPFHPKNVGPMHPDQAAPGDGVWVADPGLTNIAYKTLLHPDPDRSYAELFIAALNIEQLELHAVAGTVEPENVAAGADQLVRTGRVPDQDMGSLFAAFNGGFKTRHGGFGMRTGGVTLVPPKAESCTVAHYADGTLRIGTWSKLPEHDSIDWFRQTPGCMVEDGVQHPGLSGSKSWGATIDGDTVIRRSALGLSADGKTLFMGISNATHAGALAQGMQHAGAVQVAQLDVNHSYPRFLFYSEGGKTIAPLAEGFLVKDGQYVSDVSKRDFFYLTRKAGASLAQGQATKVARGG